MSPEDKLDDAIDGEDTLEQDAAERLKAAQAEVSADLTADMVKDEYPPGDLKDISSEVLSQIVAAVSAQFKDQIDAQEDRIGKLQQRLEKQDAERHLKNRGQFANENVKVRGRRVPVVPDHQSALVKLAHDDNPDLKDKYIRFVNTNSNIRSMRRAQGYDPVLMQDGKEVRYMDGVLMSMPREKYEEEIKGPKDDRKAFMRSSIEENFKGRLADMGVEASGDITYDKGDELDEIDQVAEIGTGKPAQSQVTEGVN